VSFKRVDFHSNIVECVEGQLMWFGVAYKIASELLGSRPIPFRDTQPTTTRASASARLERTIFDHYATTANHLVCM
jgi:hypothetical protein